MSAFVFATQVGIQRPKLYLETIANNPNQKQ